MLDGLRFHSDPENLLDSNFEFDDSHPSSSDNDSDDSSLDDVCLPLNADSSSTTKNWPDLQVLQDFYEEEMRENLAIAEANKHNVLFATGEADIDYSTVDDEEHSLKAVGFQYPLISKIDNPSSMAVPSLATRKINETEAIQGRLRPPRFSPWDKSTRQNLKNYLHNHDLENAAKYLKNNGANINDNGIGPGTVIGEKKFQQFRYTYFRPNLDSTIHSPSISGLLQDGQNFGDLFVVSQYQKAKLPPPILKENLNAPLNNAKQARLKIPPHAAGTAIIISLILTIALTVIKKARPPQSIGNNNGVGLATPMMSATNSTTVEPEDPIPFWLDVLDPTEEEIKVLSKAFGIHPLTTEDIFLNEVREKVELFKDYYFVCFRSFDIVQERLKRRALNEKLSNLESLNLEEIHSSHSADASKLSNLKKAIGKVFGSRGLGNNDYETRSHHDDYESLEAGPEIGGKNMTKKQKELTITNLKQQIKRQKSKYRELEPLNFYIIVFHEGVITFHFSPTPHPVTVRRRARLLKDYLTVSSDWIAYALIDDITDAFGPMIETIEEEVYAFEDAILKLHSGESDSEDSDDEGLNDNLSLYNSETKTITSSIVTTTSTSSYLSTSSAEWQRKGDMLRRIGESRKRIMSLLRLLGSKADVIKGLAKRCNENFDAAPRSEIGMYLGDIQDHIITMVQSLNHYEKLLARSHSNYLAQINIDMTKVNNDMNDVLGKISILGTLVLPMNVITGLWG